MDSQVLDELAERYSGQLNGDIGSNWVKGDTALEVTRLAGENGEIIDRFLSMTNETASAFKQYRWVAGVFSDEVSRSIRGITWTHYRTAAATNDPIGWLYRAHDERWSVKRLKAEIEAANDATRVELGVECAYCGERIPDADFMCSFRYARHKYLLCSLECSRDLINDLLSTCELANASSEMHAPRRGAFTSTCEPVNTPSTVSGGSSDNKEVCVR